jgi:hypothetical protein
MNASRSSVRTSCRDEYPFWALRSARVQALGARRIDEGVQRFAGTQWVRMSDPEQNEFCVSTGVEW